MAPAGTCLARALQRFAGVETVGFDYGQRHRVELDCRPTVIAALWRCGPRSLPGARVWGWGCGACPACDLRRNGWERFEAARTAHLGEPER
jgi:7-cyano-7-deazaguanine synthase in queuosine biosynthesis